LTEVLRETWTPGRGRISPDLSICSLLHNRATTQPTSIFAERKNASGVFEEITAARFAEDVTDVARGLIALGIEPGDRVGIMGSTRYEWSVVDFACLYCGGVTVPIYETSSREQVRWILTDATVKIVVAETAAMAALASEFIGTTDLERVLVIDEGAIAALTAAGGGIFPSVVRNRALQATSDSLATIVYTSGTSGRPKGVELTHGNFVTHVINGADDPNLGAVVTGQDKRTLLFLPLAHVFGRFILVLCVYSGTVVGFAPSTKNLVADLQAFRPTWLLAVPRVFETFFTTASTMAGTGFRQRVFRWATRTAQAYSHALDRDGGPTMLLRARLALADRLVFQKIRAAMGGNVTYAISGGAPLVEHLGHFFRGMGVTVMEGYGATELSAPTSVNRPGLIKIGSVGAPYPGTGIRIADDGEVMVKGGNVFRCYHNAPEATAAAFADGWFLTGDLGRLDADGYLHITGRKKEIIVTASGKNVQPAVLENALRSHPLISEVMVIGDKRPFIAALITIDAAMLPGWLKAAGLPRMSPAEAALLPQVRAELDAEVARANESVSRAESIRKYVILPREFSLEHGDLSASLKVRRPVVLEHFADEVESIYR
jgi:long-chain acyl-CoA synthetase